PPPISRRSGLRHRGIRRSRVRSLAMPRGERAPRLRSIARLVSTVTPVLVWRLWHTPPPYVTKDNPTSLHHPTHGPHVSSCYTANTIAAVITEQAHSLGQPHSLGGVVASPVTGWYGARWASS